MNGHPITLRIYHQFVSATPDLPQCSCVAEWPVKLQMTDRQRSAAVT